jgi:hypothetical protein
LKVDEKDRDEARKRLEEARKRLDQPRAESWKGENAGDEIAGIVKRLDTAETAYGTARIVVVDPGDGQLRSIWLIHDALKSQMEKLKPDVGDCIAVRYLGKLNSPKTGRSYHAYSVSTDRDRPGFKWDGGPKSAVDDLPFAGDENPFDQPLSDEPPF